MKKIISIILFLLLSMANLRANYQDNYQYIENLKNKFSLKNKMSNKNKDENNSYYFISFSMDDLAIKEAITQANLYNVPVYINGMINDNFSYTVNKIRKLLGDNSNGGLGIAPNYFNEFNIKVVPALIIKCSSHTDKITGNIPLKEALEKIAINGDCDKTATQILNGKK